ncbi:MAG: sugar ABC transporter ATP-binding protein [Verrucomicrobia bacterium]|nr:sugar ABC transporter ATP-binding protein [Verrucomicrobiota bacterium]
MGITEGAEPILELRHVSKKFPAVRALEDVSIQVKGGEIHALIGENGAGKSTLMKVVGGIHPADTGEILLDGEVLRLGTPLDALRLGIRTVHQEISLAPNLTVAENIFAGNEPTRYGLIDRRELNRRALEVLEPFKVKIPVNSRVGLLSTGLKQIVEIARAMAGSPRLLMLDEPTSSLERHETERLIGILRGLASSGIGILYVTHKLKEIFQLADRVTVLRDGRRVMVKPVSETHPGEIVRSMVGRELERIYPPAGGDIGGELLRVEGITKDSAFEDVSFTLRRGEILGFSGLIGAGRTEVAQSLFGYLRKDAGAVYLNGERLDIRCPTDSLNSGIAYLPEERKALGLYLGMSVVDNFVSANLRKYSRLGILSGREMDGACAGAVDMFRIRTPSIRQHVRFLSGGNQQKLLLARLLALKPRILIADEPTRGIDVGAKSEVHTMLRRLCDEGVGVIVISSELPEVLGLCDRILVFHEGRISGEVSRRAATEEKIMHLATGGGLSVEET